RDRAAALRSAGRHPRGGHRRARTAGRRVRRGRGVTMAEQQPPAGAGRSPLDRRTAMRAIVSWSLNFRFLVVAAAIALMAVGIATIPRTPVDVFPEFAPPQVEVQTESLGLSTSDVESLVTVPLELSLNGMPGLADLRSTSVPQLSSI